MGSGIDVRMGATMTRTVRGNSMYSAITLDDDGKAWVWPGVVRGWARWLSLSTLVQATVEGTVVITVLQKPPSTNIETYHAQCNTEEEATQLAGELTLEWALR